MKRCLMQLASSQSLPPGEVKLLTLDLSPGKYIVLCNIAGHFSNGMYASLEILAN